MLVSCMIRVGVLLRLTQIPIEFQHDHQHREGKISTYCVRVLRINSFATSKGLLGNEQAEFGRSRCRVDWPTVVGRPGLQSAGIRYLRIITGHMIVCFPPRWNECFTFVLLGRRNTCEFGVNLIVLRDLQHCGAVLNHPRQQIRSPGNLKDVLNVWEIIWGEINQQRYEQFTARCIRWMRHCGQTLVFGGSGSVDQSLTLG